MAISTEAITTQIVSDLSLELSISATQIESTLKLLLSDCTIPFIARYRKEATVGLDEVQIRDIRDRFEYIAALNERRDAIIKSIEEQGKLTPEFKTRLICCKNKSELEDLYLPYKPKKRTRGQIAKERGLEPLAMRVYLQEESSLAIQSEAELLVGTHPDLKTAENVVAGIRDIISELISENADIRGEIRNWTYDNAAFSSSVKEEFRDKRTKFNDYYDFKEPVKSIPPHRLMAIRRGEKEEILKVALEFDEAIPVGMIESRVIRTQSSTSVCACLREAAKESYARIISPSIETEIRLESKGRAEEDAITVFAKNLRNLLLLPPIPKRVVMGVDPGFRTGSKLVVVDGTGKLLEHITIYPDHDVLLSEGKNLVFREKMLELLRKHRVEYVSIGNGTAGREMEAFVEAALDSDRSIVVKIVMVNESGASVYSASDVAREEFPDLDISYRGAVSIARRLQDPLAELVKIDPKSIGVGQYQHDVNQGKLKRSLEDVVESCVNFVGVNLNTASSSLLSYVSGIGPSLARAIVTFRNNHGEFRTRKGLLEIPGFGGKTFEQAAGFLRIIGGDDPLDGSAVHPESYSIVEKMAESIGVELKELVGNVANVQRLNLAAFEQGEVGSLTLRDIAKELGKPGRDPRADGVKMSYTKTVRAFEQLQEGQVLTGTVTNVTNFGAFVDIGVHQDGLIHLSEISREFIRNAAEHISVGDLVRVKVIGVDKERKRISLSKKALEEGPTGNNVGASAAARTPAPTSRESRPNSRTEKPSTNSRAAVKSFNKKEEKTTETQKSSVSDLLNKFNSGRL